MSSEKSNQGRRNMVKVARAAIRLKHSIAADEEIAERLPDLIKRYDKAVLQGKLPDAADVLRAFDV